ncbi:MAG TPA: cobalamin biosynthesis protein [Cyanobacteria bacterium UBA8530]|nr:cobalamin biosynthesis protein [Cyanobacteria bacterium UBA8530]
MPKKTIAALFAMAILSPVGLLLPHFFKAGSAWGEWSPEEILKMTGRVPEGLAHFSNLWQAPFPDYSFAVWQNVPLWQQGLALVFSALAGGLSILGLGWLLGRCLLKP